MANDEIFDKITEDLVNREANAANNIMFLNSQGYVVNRLKQDKLSIIIMLLFGARNKDIFTEEQQDDFKHLYYNFITL